MRVFKIKVRGLKLFKEEFEIDFLTKQRVRDESSEILYKVAPKIYKNNALAFIGINASGKTSTLKVISFVIHMLNNESINSIKENEILNGLDYNQEIVFDTFFCVKAKTIYRLETIIKINKNSKDRKNKYIISEEKMWCKEISKVKTRKSLFEFNGIEPINIRKGDEEFLPEDVSIVIALNKKENSQIYFQDLINWTDSNLIRIIGKFPMQLIKFLDPNIEYLNGRPLENEKKMEIKLKFYGKEEIILNSTYELQHYLSSGTIKGINVFIMAIMVLQNGGYLLIDELENHFNREIVSTLIRFFMDKKLNLKGATLIFSTHYSELLDEFDRNDEIYIVRNNFGITVDNLSALLKRNDIKKSEIYQSGYLGGTTPIYEAYMGLKKEIKREINNISIKEV